MNIFDRIDISTTIAATDINLTAEDDIIIPANVGIVMGNTGLESYLLRSIL